MSSFTAHIHQKTIIPLLFVMICSTGKAQQTENTFVFSSRIIAADSATKAIKNCHIVNKTKRTGTVSNESGDFKIVADVNDSISFSAIGYEKLTIAITDSMYNYGHIVWLTPATYELSEVNITNTDSSLFEFPRLSKFEISTPLLPNQGGFNIPTGFSPATFIYNLFGKEAKRQRHHKKAIDGSADYMVIGEKFNGAIVKRLTGLEDDELIQFMASCAFTTEFLLQVSPETINRAILSKYQEYMKNKSGNP